MLRLVLLGSTILLLGGCATAGQTGIDPSLVPQGPASYRADVHANYTSGRLLELSETETPGLKELINIKKGTDAPLENPEDKLRYPALREAALSYGARGGLSYTSRQINRMLQDRAADFNSIYDFEKVMVPGPEGTMVLPPIIVEARDAYEIEDEGKTLRLADRVYEILQQARFSPVAPLWHSYLIREYSPPSPPPHALLPKNDGERDLWGRWVTEGWMMGVEQAHEIFQSDLNKLERDFTGMLRYRTLLAEGKVSEPVAANTELGITGTGQNMRVNDRAVRITKEAILELDVENWRPTVSSLDRQSSATPPGKESPQPPKNRVEVELLEEEIAQEVDKALSKVDSVYEGRRPAALRNEVESREGARIPMVGASNTADALPSQAAPQQQVPASQAATPAQPTQKAPRVRRF